MKVYIVGHNCGDGSQAFLITSKKDEALEWMRADEDEIGKDGFYESGMLIEKEINIVNNQLVESIHFDTDC